MDKTEDEIMELTSNYDATTRRNIDSKLNAYGKKLLSYVNRQVFRFKTEGCPNLNIRALDQMVPA